MAIAEPLAPPGWQVNPSVLGRRAVVVTLGFVGLVAAVACTLHARGVVPRLWEPLPIMSAGGLALPAVEAPLPELDVIGFTAIVVATMLGGADRWRSEPALALATGAAVAATAVSLLVRWSWQYYSLGTTSTLFFFCAAVSVVLLPLVADEVYAGALGLAARGRLSSPRPTREWAARAAPVSDWPGYLAGIGGVLLGFWLLLSPALPLSERATRHGHLIGAFVVAFGALALAQVARAARWFNVGVGAWLLVAPLALGYDLRGTLRSMIVGLLLMMVSTVLADADAGRGRRVYRIG